MNGFDSFLIGASRFLGTTVIVLAFVAVCLGLLYVCVHGLAAVGLHLPGFKKMDKETMGRVMDWSNREDMRLLCWGRYGVVLITMGRKPWIGKIVDRLFRDKEQPTSHDAATRREASKSEALQNETNEDEL